MQLSLSAAALPPGAAADRQVTFEPAQAAYAARVKSASPTADAS